MNPRLTDAATHQFYNSEANAIYNESKFDQVSDSSTFEERANLANLQVIDRCRGSAKGTLLEIGSGKGDFLLKAKALGYQICGLELNKKNCQHSRELLGEANAVLEADLLEAQFPSEKFDAIYMRDLIQHIPDPKTFLRECHRVAKPGCTLFIGTHNIDGLLPKIVKSKYTPVFGFMEPNHYSPRTIKKILNETGFAVRDIQFESIDCTVSEILGYFAVPTFTTIFPVEITQGKSRFLYLLRTLLLRQPLRYLDGHLFPQIANWLRQGSWMNVLAEKRAL